MLDIGSSELLMIVIVAVVVIGPKDLPRALYKLGQIMGKARAMSRHFRTGLDAMIREAEVEEMEKKWSADNERIMKQYPAAGSEGQEPVMEALPAPAVLPQVEPDPAPATAHSIPDSRSVTPPSPSDTVAQPRLPLGEQGEGEPEPRPHAAGKSA